MNPEETETTMERVKIYLCINGEWVTPSDPRQREELERILEGEPAKEDEGEEE